MSKIIIIDSRVSGFNGEPCRVLAICNPNSGKTLIKKLADFKEPATKKGDTLIVTDNPRLPYFGLLFNEKTHTKEIIQTYNQAAKTNNIQFEPALKAYDPQGYLQAAKIDESGVQYEFNADIGNGVMAVLLAIWGATMASRGQAITNAFDDTPLPTPNNMQGFMALPFSV